MAWESCSAAQILALWDNADKQSWYLPADSLEPHIGPSIVGVIQRRCIGLRSQKYKPLNVHIRALSSDLASAFYELEWSRTTEAAVVGGRVRVTMVMRKMVMRKIEAAWRVFHYAEAPLAPLLELQTYYERVAAQGLEAMPQRVWPA